MATVMLYKSGGKHTIWEIPNIDIIVVSDTDKEKYLADGWVTTPLDIDKKSDSTSTVETKTEVKTEVNDVKPVETAAETPAVAAEAETVTTAEPAAPEATDGTISAEKAEEPEAEEAKADDSATEASDTEAK